MVSTRNKGLENLHFVGGSLIKLTKTLKIFILDVPNWAVCVMASYYYNNQNHSLFIPFSLGADGRRRLPNPELIPIFVA